MPADPRRAVLPAATVAAAAILWFGADLPPVIGLAAACLYALVLPGLALAWPRNRDRDLPARLALAGGSSLAVTVLVGLLLNLFGPLTQEAWVLGLGAAILLAWATAPAPVPATALRLPSRRAALPLLIGFLFFGTMSASAIVIARQGAEAHREFAFTEFWMVPDEDTGRRLVTVGIANHEGESARYEVDLVVDGGIVGQLPAMGIEPGESWSTRFAFPVAAKGAPRKVEAWLYRDGIRTNVYRKAWAWN